MNIKISVSAVGLNLNATLKDEALPHIIKLTQEFRDEQSVPSSSAVDMASRADATSPLATNITEENIKNRLAEHGAAELLNCLRWESYPEKILLLAAWFEAKGGSVPWRSADMDEAFKQAKDKSPANFPRDIKQAVKAGWIHANTPRKYSVTRTGWNKIGEALKDSIL
jgi:hypothetical protein